MRSGNHVLLVALVLVVSVVALPALALGIHVTGSPEVQILAPLAGQTVSSVGVRLQISVSNFSLDGASIGGANEANHGHYHVWVNDTFTGLLTAAPIVDVSTFPVGPMKLGVSLVNNDHSQLSPQVWHNISVTVVAPSVTFLHPTDGGTVSTMGARFQLDVQGFELDTENYGGEPIPGHGHYHAFVDIGTPNETFIGTPTEPFFDVGALTPGPHNITVNLRTNNHALLSPNIEATMMVTAVEPSIKIVSPANNAGVSGQGFRLVVDIAGWELDVENYNGNPIPGHGHYHVIVDGTSTVGTPQQRTFSVPSLADGTHTITVNLRMNNHSLLSPNVEDTITVNVGGPSIAIVSPAEGSMVSSRGFQLQVEVTGFELDAENYGGDPIPGRGHYHVVIDGATAGTPTGRTFDVGALAAGSHTIVVNLRTNNHALLVPNAEATITVTTVDPSISIVSPLAGAVSTLGFGLEVAIAGWELDAENYNGNPIPGRGHYHVFVDGALAGTPTIPTFRIDSLTAGSHTITVDLRTNNHQLLSPTVEASITVTAAAPSISILEPADGATVGATVALRVDIGGFTIYPEAIELANVPGRGHYHVTVDGTTIDFQVTGPVYAIEDLAEGDHTVEVSLHNNDHSALSPAVSDQVTITVAAAAPPPPAGVDSLVFIATTVSLIVVLVVVAAVLYLWGRKGKEGT